ncbi:hypothetical protein [Luteolibacter sp. Populi]|uniref:hypothetical protein n=1 Tax=Luteolibacter sp. Populi TaxID=3230487 RepID=UPI0034670C44
METQRILVTAATILACAAAEADVIQTLSLNKLFYQTAPMSLRFESGQLRVFLRDGLVILDGACVIDPQLFFFPPSNIPPCPLGATGFVATGDVDRDGIRDDNQYWSVAGVIPAFVVEPSRPELCQLYSAPPSKLERPLSNFRDDAVVTFYDISTAFVQQYDQSRYELIRPYGAVRQMETVYALGDVLTTGTVIATVTSADIVGPPVTVTFNVTATQTGAAWSQALRAALASIPAIDNIYTIGGAGTVVTLTERVPNGNDPGLNVALAPGTAVVLGLPAPTSEDTTPGSTTNQAAALKKMNEEVIPGQYVFTYPRLNFPDLTPVAIPVTIVPSLDALNPASRTPRAGFRFTSGTWDRDVYQMDPRSINKVKWTGNDRTNIRPGDRIFFSILNDSEDFLLFPPTVPQNPVFIPTPTAQQYTLPPFFFDVGQTGVMELSYERNLYSSGVSIDTSERKFRAKVMMVDSYPGFAAITLPTGTAKREYAAKADYDRDGMSNIEEFGFQVLTYEEVNARAREQFEPLASDVPVIYQAFGYVSQFSKVVTKYNNPIVNKDVKPAGMAPPYLDADNKIVIEAPLRPNTGNTLKYNYTQTIGGKKKGQKLKIGKDWEQFVTTTTATENVVIEVRIIDPEDGATVLLVNRGGQTPVTVTRPTLVTRSINPVDPAAPLPTIKLTLSTLTLNK